jgi:hypothetical protein
MEKQTKEQIPSVEEYWESKSELTYAEWVYQQGRTQAISEFKEKPKEEIKKESKSWIDLYDIADKFVQLMMIFWCWTIILASIFLTWLVWSLLTGAIEL